MAVQNHQATNCGTAKGHIHKLGMQIFLNPFLFSQTFCSPEFIEGSHQKVQMFSHTWGLDKIDEGVMLS